MLSLLCIHRIYADTFHVDKSDDKGLEIALKKAQNGDVIVLNGGKYEGNFTLTKSIDLVGKNMPMISAIEDKPILSIHNATFKIHGVEFIGKLNSNTNNSCIDVKDGSITFFNNALRDCSVGMVLKNTWDNWIKNNVFIADDRSNLSLRGEVVKILSTHDSSIEDNLLSYGGDAIYIEDSYNVHLNNNTIHHARFGFHVMNSQNLTIDNNAVYNASVAMNLMYSKRLMIKNNIAKHNNIHGYVLREISQSTFFDNLADTNEDGIVLSASHDNVIHNNEIINNTYGAIISFGSVNNRVYNNNFINNRLEVKYGNFKNTYWGYKGRGNYWSSYRCYGNCRGATGPSPYYVNNLAQWLSFSYPILHVIFDSPIMKVLQGIENMFPVLQSNSLIDKYPLTKRVSRDV
ncbi:NosD domain-containing protein [Cysteiniphilum sp. 19S12-1]